MTCQETVYRWRDQLQEHFPHLSRPQLLGLALWSLGIVMTHSCSLTFITHLLSEALEQSAGNLRQRLREWYWDAPHKRGRQRRELEVESCFAPLLRWILQMYPGQILALGLDATVLEDRFVVLCISVLYQGSAFPVAWHIVPAHEAKSWRPHWLRLLRRLRPAVPPDMEVLVLADRGLWARWLFHRIVRLGWHPFLRVNLGGSFKPWNWRENQSGLAGNPAKLDPRHTARAGYVSFATLVAQLEGHGGIRGTAFLDERAVPCTLTVYRDKNYAEPWLVLTDLLPEQCDAQWYAVRAWIEHGFKFLKREGWRWNRTRIQDPERAKRHWLALAVSLLWVQTIGQAAQTHPSETHPSASGPALEPSMASAATWNPPRVRSQSLFRSGLITLLVRLWRGEGLVLDFGCPPPRSNQPPLATAARAPT